MENINIAQTKFTPSIFFDLEKGLLEMKGDSLPENTSEFYKPLMDTLAEYLLNPKDETVVDMELTYFNSSSSKLLYDFFDLFVEKKNNSKITINWYYEKDNESMEEYGEDFQDDFKTLVFNVIEK